MEETFQIPARPWGEAEIAFLIRNVDKLPEEIRHEMGIVPVVPDDSFQADFDAAHVVVEEPVVEEVVVEEPVVEPTVEEEVVVTEPVVEEVVDNKDADIA